MNTETYYGWRVWFEDANEPNGGHFIFPRSNPREHEDPVDYMYDTQAQAIEVLQDQEWVEEAVVDNWVLVKVTEEPVKLDLLALRVPQLHIHFTHIDCKVTPSVTWEDTWSSAVDEDCPACGMRHIVPVSWHAVGEPCPTEDSQ